jgi:hypothetical protein
MGLSLTGVAVVIFGTVAGPAAGTVAGICAVTALLGFWALLPLRLRHEPPPTTE